MAAAALTLEDAAGAIALEELCEKLGARRVAELLSSLDAALKLELGRLHPRDRPAFLAALREEANAAAVAVVQQAIGIAPDEDLWNPGGGGSGGNEMDDDTPPARVGRVVAGRNAAVAAAIALVREASSRVVDLLDGRLCDSPACARVAAVADGSVVRCEVHDREEQTRAPTPSFVRHTVEIFCGVRVARLLDPDEAVIGGSIARVPLPEPVELVAQCVACVASCGRSRSRMRAHAWADAATIHVHTLGGSYPAAAVTHVYCVERDCGAIKSVTSQRAGKTLAYTVLSPHALVARDLLAFFSSANVATKYGLPAEAARAIVIARASAGTPPPPMGPFRAATFAQYAVAAVLATPERLAGVTCFACPLVEAPLASEAAGAPTDADAAPAAPATPAASAAAAVSAAASSHAAACADPRYASAAPRE